MKCYLLCTSLFLVFLCFVTPDGFAGDGERKGFAIGGGVGIGASSQEVSNSGTSTSFAVATNFRVGFAATNALSIFYLHKTAWSNVTETIVAGEFGGPLTPQDVDFVLTNGLSGVGFDYFFKPTEPSWFVSGGVGLAWWAQPFEENTDCILPPLAVFVPCLETTGFGAVIGAGYEFKKHLTVELNVMWGTPNGRLSNLVDVTSDAFHAFVTINYLAY